MANSGIYWIDVTFNWCVRLLYEVAGWLGITYEEINVYLFVIIGPLVLLTSILLNIYLLSKTKVKPLTKNPYSSEKESVPTEMLMTYTHLKAAEDISKKLILRVPYH